MQGRLIVIAVLLFSISGIAQQTMAFKGSKNYPETQTWDFLCEQYAMTGIVHVQVSKTEDGGALKLSVETSNPTFVIGGTVYVYLADHSLITCLDKAVRESNGNQIAGYYKLSASETKKMKASDIESIRFWIKGTQGVFSSQTGNFTALNKKGYFAGSFDKEKSSFDTALEINSL